MAQELINMKGEDDAKICSEEQTDYHVVHGSMQLFAIADGEGYKLYFRNSEQVYDRIFGYYTYSGWPNKVVVVCSLGRFGLVDAITGEEILSPADSPITDFVDGVYAPEPYCLNHFVCKLCTNLKEKAPANFFTSASF